MCLRIFFRRFLMTLPMRRLTFLAVQRPPLKPDHTNNEMQDTDLRAHRRLHAQPKSGREGFPRKTLLRIPS